MLGNARYKTRCVGVSELGFNVPSTTLPLASETTTMCSGFISEYGTPLGLMTMTPRSRSTALALPHVWMTNPSATKSKFAWQTSAFNFSSIKSFPHPPANLNQLFHHVEQIAVPFLRAEGVVQRPVERIQFAVDFMRLRIRLVDFRFQAGHFLLRRGVILVRAGHHRRPDGRAERAGLRRAAH